MSSPGPAARGTIATWKPHRIQSTRVFDRNPFLQRRYPMFDKFGEAAERLATDLSRRQMLGRCARSALALAGVLGGVLALPGIASADQCPPGEIYARCPD